MGALSINLHGETFELLPEKAVYRPLLKQLIFADIHLGKAVHFRKAGIPLPANSSQTDIEKMKGLVEKHKPEQVIILGDLFHSDLNSEWELFTGLLDCCAPIDFFLVKGNHDILKKEFYEIPHLHVVDELEEEHFLWTHHPVEKSVKLNFCGHIHPGIVIKGKGRQGLKLPCFYHCNNQFIIPAYGRLTGLYTLPLIKDCMAYVIGGDKVYDVSIKSRKKAV
ncbi:MAG: ligase-associated DNA damage response endonuclease PdeM [Bacteroidia bacterium]|nr:ligase-associated DNA damage response endonuclease PdeM [Bacteroidia bacterium]